WTDSSQRPTAVKTWEVTIRGRFTGTKTEESNKYHISYVRLRSRFSDELITITESAIEANSNKSNAARTSVTRSYCGTRANASRGSSVTFSIWLFTSCLRTLCKKVISAVKFSVSLRLTMASGK